MAQAEQRFLATESGLHSDLHGNRRLSQSLVCWGVGVCR